MTDAPPPPDMELSLPAPLRRARGVAMTVGLVMTPLLILAGAWADRGAPVLPISARESATASLRPTIAPEPGQR